MAKTNQKSKAKSVPEQQPDKTFRLKRMYFIHNWEAQHHPDHSEIEAYSELEGEHVIIADIKTANHVALADFIVAVVNQHNQSGDLFESAIATLESLLERRVVDFTIEHDAEVIVRKAREAFG